MSTILGIRALDGIVILADTQLNHEDNEGKLEKKSRTCKIVTGKNYAIASTGSVDEAETNFFEYIDEKISLRKFLGIIKEKKGYFREKKDKTPLEQAINDEEFFGLRKYNDYLVGKGSDAMELIIATKNQFGLYNCSDRGKIITNKGNTGLDYFSRGTGGVEVSEFIDNGDYKKHLRLKEISLAGLDIKGAILLGTAAINKAIEKDPYSGGNVDIAVVTTTKPPQFYGGENLKKRIEQRVWKIYECIANKY